MAQIITFLALSLLVLTLTLVQAQQHPVAPRRARSRARVFIESQCQTTLYPTLCVKCLSPYVPSFTKTLSHRQLAQIALKVTLVRAETTQAYINGVAQRLNRTKGPEARSVKECLDQINDGVDQLTKCIKEAQHIKEDGGSSSEFTWHASNVQTWMSTALTDASMCIDGISGRAIGGKTKALIKARVLNLQQVTSIALALFNRFAARFRAAHLLKP
ncbi:pectinesterase inhibitor 9-like [Salvia miltiorrhiza]|uniref:pectinesterase inhibitor 9-like n=1 Tax=Salvia miltiorrhiza TaxID=226208 RepID=UPI0025AC2938|nr:pectinesterase inhibitor 9-like [Salvia miltiorrhiza]